MYTICQKQILQIVLLHINVILLNCFFLFFIRLRLELLTQFPASYNEK